MGGRAEIYPADLSNINSINHLVESIKQKHKVVDIIVNVAGIWHGKDEVYANRDFETFDQQVILDTYTVGITAPTLLAHALIPLMPKGARIINISGTFEDGAKGWLQYYVSKKAVEDLTVGLSEELRVRGILVNCISPSDTATEEYQKYFPEYAKDALSPEEIANQVAFLCSPQGDKINGEVRVLKKI